MNNNLLFGSLNGSVSLLLGVGRSNLALAEYLVKQGGRVIMCDRSKSEKEISKILEEKNLAGCDIVKYGTIPKTDFVFRTPVIRPDDEIICNSLQRGAFLTSEIELFFEKCKGCVYGITGSDGKTTTATITCELYKNADKKVFLGGNIGVPLISFVNDVTENDVVIAELSSFQLMTLKRSPNRSAITNLSENHLDWHIDKKEYIEAKANIYTYHDCKRLVTEFSAYNLLKELHKPIPRECILIGENQDVYSDGKDICIFGKKTVQVSDIVLKGEHNLKNFMTAVAISYPDIPKEALIKTARSFRGIAHRIEFVDTKHGISFFNSSIDSTPSRTLNTLKCFGSNITLICGGYDKNLDYSELAEYVNNHIKNLVLYGDAAEKIYSYFQKSGSAKVNIIKTDSFDNAFKNAAEMAKKGETVLLSPACASFDQFKDFQERGERFSKLVRSLI